MTYKYRDNNTKDISLSLKCIIKKLNIKQKDFANKINISSGRLTNYLKGTRMIPHDILQKIIETFNINPAFFYLKNEPIFLITKYPNKFKKSDIIIAKKWFKEIAINTNIKKEDLKYINKLDDENFIKYVNFLKNIIQSDIKK